VWCSAWLCTRFINGDVKLCLLVHDRCLEIWGNGEKEDGKAGLICAHAVHVGSGEPGLFGMEPMCLAEKSGTMLVLYNSDLDHAYLLDIHSGSTTMVAGWRSSLNYKTLCPMRSIGWSSLCLGLVSNNNSSCVVCELWYSSICFTWRFDHNYFLMTSLVN
jgi:hypothetical protein